MSELKPELHEATKKILEHLKEETFIKLADKINDPNFRKSFKYSAFKNFLKTL